MTDRFANLISGFKTSNLGVNLNISFTNVTSLLPKNFVPANFTGQEEPIKRTPEQLEEEIKNVKQQIKQEQKSLEDLPVLIALYEKSKDQQGLEQAQKAMQDIEQKIEDLKKKKEQLKDERPPRPLPQLEFVTVSSTNPKQEGTTVMLSAPPKLDLTEVQQFLSNQSSASQKKASMRAANSGATEPAKPKIRYAILLWDFQAREAEELTVRAKELVSVVQSYGYEESDTDWWKVCNALGKEGFVPSNYLEPVGESGKKTATLTVQLPFEALALYDYVALKEGELSFYYGDILKVTKMDYPGWWTAELEDGTWGLIPSNYVQKLTEQMKQKLIEQREAMQKLAEAKVREQELAAQQAQQEAENPRPTSQTEPPSTAYTAASTAPKPKTAEPTQPTSSQKTTSEESPKITKPLPTPEPKSNVSSSTRSAAIISPSKPTTRAPASNPPSTTPSTNPSATPTPPPKEEPPRQVQGPTLTEKEQQDFPPFGEAILDYTAIRSDELSFQMGEILRIVSHPIKGWYKAYILKGPSSLPKASFKHLMGLIPSNLIVEIPEKEAMEKAVNLEVKKQLPRKLARRSTVNHPLLDD